MFKTFKTLILAVFFTLIAYSQAFAGNGINLRFAWNAVTTNVDGEPCTNLAGYTIYRSAVADDWGLLTGLEAAHKIIPEPDTTVSIQCPDPGVWFWIVRAYNNSGNFSAPSNVISTELDLSVPGAVDQFKTCVFGDYDCDGDVDGADLAAFAEEFGNEN